MGLFDRVFLFLSQVFESPWYKVILSCCLLLTIEGSSIVIVVGPVVLLTGPKIFLVILMLTCDRLQLGFLSAMMMTVLSTTVSRLWLVVESRLSTI